MLICLCLKYNFRTDKKYLNLPISRRPIIKYFKGNVFLQRTWIFINLKGHIPRVCSQWSIPSGLFPRDRFPFNLELIRFFIVCYHFPILFHFITFVGVQWVILIIFTLEGGCLNRAFQVCPSTTDNRVKMEWSWKHMFICIDSWPTCIYLTLYMIVKMNLEFKSHINS